MALTIRELQDEQHRMSGETRGYRHVLISQSLSQPGSSHGTSAFRTADGGTGVSGNGGDAGNGSGGDGTDGSTPRRVRFASTPASTGNSPPSVGSSPIRETGARSRATIRRSLSSFTGMFRAGRQLDAERGESVEMTTIPKDGKLIHFILIFAW